MGSPDMVFRWRKSSRSGEAGSCVELASVGAVRDSKNPTGPTITVELDALITSIKSGKFDS